MRTHFTLMLIFSILVSLVFAFIAKEEAGERAKYFLYLLGSFLILSLVVGWLMYPFPMK
jgi:cytochrome bd-type quinol oxidase subunit 2